MLTYVDINNDINNVELLYGVVSCSCHQEGKCERCMLQCRAPNCQTETSVAEVSIASAALWSGFEKLLKIS